MNLSQIKTKTLQIIREYSSNGSIIGSGDNLDYLMSMNNFINDAQFELNKNRPIVRKITLGTPNETTETYNKYPMPVDFSELKELKNGDNKFTDFLFEEKTLLIPKSYEGTFYLWYYAYPTVIDNSANDSTELEIDLDLQMIIPYYTAGHVIIDENPSLAEFFLNEYNLKRRRTAPKTTQRTINNQYGY